MSYAVKICVMFRCYNNDALAKIANDHLSKLGLVLPPGDDWPDDGNQPELIAADLNMNDFESWHSLCFLTDMARRTGYNKGRNGGMVTWGTITNYGIPDVFAEDLKDFWYDIMKDEDTCCLDNILIFYEREQEEYANCIEIKCPYTKGKGRLKESMVFKDHLRLPFSWADWGTT